MLSNAVAVLGVGVLAPAVSAADEWCADDPAVVIRTPGGNTVVVHVVNEALGTEHAAAVRKAAITTSTRRAGASATEVEIQVTVPNDASAAGFSTRTSASTLPWGRGTLLATATGKSGRAMKLRFRLDVP